MIEWSSFAIVAAATWISAVIVIALFSVAVRLRASHLDRVEEGRGNAALPVAYWTVFGICGLVVVLGVYLIVPALHGA